jgi:hypothetical protein
MSDCEVQRVVDEDRDCIEVPTEYSVGDALKKASWQSEVKGVSLWHSGVELNLDHLFADHFEPEAIHHTVV